jgi:hypothetical protein
MRKPKTPKRVNPVARALRSGHLRPKVIPSKKAVYSRKGKAHLITAVALLALAPPAHATPKHTWYQLRYDTATCVVSPQTPQEFQEGHGAERITPDDAVKYNDGTLAVTVRGTLNGKPVKWRFFSTKEMCGIWLMDVKPQQAPNSDIN